MKISTAFSLGFLLGTSYLTGAMAQQVNGTLGSPSATTTIDGKQLPPPPSKFGGVITELSTGYPGYDSIITPDKATIGTILKGNGHTTSWFGKNHNTPGFQYSVAGPFDQWPSGMGFDYFYGLMGGETDQWT